MSALGSGAVRAALEALGVQRLLLGIHDASFPSDADDDTGRGAPASEAGFRFLAFAHELGFDGLQLGPQGLTAPDDPSPYQGCAFSRDPLSISLGRLAGDAWEGLLLPHELRAWVEARPAGGETRVPHRYVARAHREALAQAGARFFERARAGRAPELAHRFAAFRRAHAEWLERDARFEEGTGTASAALFRFAQWVAHEQHDAVRAEARRLGLRLYGDLAIGLSERDARACGRFLLRGYRLGAPPSRTNPEGQDWHLPLFHPEQVHDGERPGPALAFFASRVEKLLSEFDGVRIDHPQGLVCPWVYRSGAPDRLEAVRLGARLFASPDLPDHPELARFAIARREQLHPDRTTPRHADDWVVALEPEQVDRYALLFDRLVEIARAQGRDAHDLACEVLSTLPHPLRCVLERHGLGRFRVTLKADPNDADDPYGSERAAAEDWVMLGNHDTEPIWQLLPAWRERGELAERARRAAERLAHPPAEPAALAARLAAQPGLLAHALFAELFASRAEHVLIYFTDLFGMTEPYNRPGTVSPENWSLRLPQRYESEHRERRGDLRALDLPLALGLALRARGAGETCAGRELLAGLATLSAPLRAELA